MTVDDQFRLITPGNPSISPDGRWILYSTESMSLEENARHSTTWIGSTDNRVPPRRFLCEGDATPMWSPDSRSVFFLRSVTSGEIRSRELFEQRVDDTVATQRSKLGPEASGIRSWQLSRDGRFFLVLRQETNPTAPGAESGAVYVDEGSNGQTRDYWLNLWQYDVAERCLRRITQREWWIYSANLSPNGRYAVIAAQPDNGRNTKWKSELFVVDLSTDSIQQITSNVVPELNPVWFPNGKAILFSAVRLDRWVHGNGDLWTIEIPSGKTRNLTPNHTGRFDPPFVVSPDGKFVFAGSGYGTTRFPVSIDVASGKIERLIATDGVARLGSWTDDRQTYAYIYNDFITPPDVYVAQTNATGDRQTRITILNPWVQEEIELGSVQRVDWPSFDGRKIEGLLYAPPNHAPMDQKPLPMIVQVACGPGCAWLNSFSIKNQVFAGLGFAQFMPNMRGASNYDDAHMRGNEFDIGGGDLQDVMTGVDAMIARGIADPDKLGITGWSYGGALGGYIITQTDRFKAASLGAMVSDYSAEYGPIAFYDMELWYLGGNPWTNSAHWRERSSITYVNRVKTPVLLHHGDLDDSCSPFQSMNYFIGLRRVGTPTRFIRYPDESHDLYLPRNLQLRDKEDVSWMQYYVLGRRHLDVVRTLPAVHAPGPVLPPGQSGK